MCAPVARATAMTCRVLGMRPVSWNCFGHISTLVIGNRDINAAKRDVLWWGKWQDPSVKKVTGESGQSSDLPHKRFINNRLRMKVVTHTNELLMRGLPNNSTGGLPAELLEVKFQNTNRSSAFMMETRVPSKLIKETVMDTDIITQQEPA